MSDGTQLHSGLGLEVSSGLLECLLRRLGEDNVGHVFVAFFCWGDGEGPEEDDSQKEADVCREGKPRDDVKRNGLLAINVN